MKTAAGHIVGRQVIVRSEIKGRTKPGLVIIHQKASDYDKRDKNAQAAFDSFPHSLSSLFELFYQPSPE